MDKSDLIIYMELLKCISCGKIIEWTGVSSVLEKDETRVPFSDDEGYGLGICKECASEKTFNFPLNIQANKN